MHRHLTDALLQILHIRILANTFKQLLEFFAFLPLRKPFVHCLPRTIVFRKITPGSPGVHDPENSIHTSDFCKMLFDFFQTIEFRNALQFKIKIKVQVEMNNFLHRCDKRSIHIFRKRIIRVNSVSYFLRGYI